MSTVKSVLLPLLLAAGVAQAGHAECHFPKRPIIPDGKTVSKEHLLEVIHAFKTEFQPDVRKFQNCIKNERIAVGDFATDEQKEEWTSRHDAAFDIESRLANALNQAIRDFKSRETAGDTSPQEKAAHTSDSTETSAGEDDGDTSGQ
ncbi:hypothetical protein [Emcibacter nanhaiensis]|uniref:Uncharacterized protein n=1 Tax=Emcibacter nanhaiensis TaxID=1505037 RepID=A0A501PN50_9PROT|nr:hypothetical protein [Emcibacter nanhaiensis]TPD61869.1 hypothetical protein FIV46_06575 [Emcibacter nanhaiensis]